MTEAIVLLSGGIDSAVCLGLAIRDYDEVKPVHYDYGQQTQEFEAQQAQNLVRHHRHEGNAVHPITTINYEDVFSVFGQGVASDRDSFVSDEGGLEEDDGRSTGFVPMRNLHLLASGAGLADVRGSDAVYIGVQGGDEEAYPDCRPQFIAAANEAINRSLADDDSLDVRAPLLHHSKVEVISLGENLDVPWEYTYSCYEAIEDDDPEPCGTCPACIERGEAFYAAQVNDPFKTLASIQTNNEDEWERIRTEVSFR